MLARHSRVVIPRISRWARYNSGNSNKPTPSAVKQSENTEPLTPEQTTQPSTKDAFASMLQQQKLNTKPSESQSSPTDYHQPRSETGVEGPTVAADISGSSSEVSQSSEPLLGGSSGASVPPSEGGAQTMQAIHETRGLDFSDLSPSQKALVEEIRSACNSQTEFETMVSSPDFAHLLSLQAMQDLASIPEPVISSQIIPGRSLYLPVQHEPPYRIPAATITFKGYDSQSILLFTHFAIHAASALGIPTSKVYALPKQRSLWTVPRSPFVFKKSQENFERITHSRGIKAWDATPEIIDLWAGLLRRHAMPGVGMRVVRWRREEIGGGAKGVREIEEKAGKMFNAKKQVGDAEKVKRVGEQIMQKELEAAKQAELETTS